MPYLIQVHNGLGETLWVREVLRAGRGFQVGTKRHARRFDSYADAVRTYCRFRSVVKGTKYTIHKVKP